MVNNSDLTILTVVENDKGTFDLLISSIYKFSDPVPKIIICSNGKNGETLEKYLNDENITIVSNKPNMVGGNNRHGEGLNKIFPLVKTPRTAIVESDCILLSNNWNKMDSGYKMLAAQKANNFYHICFTLFETEALKGIDFRPGNDTNRANRSYKIAEDVGWQIGNKINKDSIQLLEHIDCKSGKGKVFDKRFQSDEFWLNDEPIVAHFGRGSNIKGKAIRKGFKHPEEQLVEWKKTAERILG